VTGWIPPGAAVPPPPSTFPFGGDPDQALWDKLKARPTKYISVVALAAGKAIFTGACIIIGFAFRETAQGAAWADLFDGADSTGNLVGSIAMVAAGGVAGGVGTDGVLCKSGVFFARGSGTWQGGMWVKA
jgi:hypothetical protein